MLEATTRPTDNENVRTSPMTTIVSWTDSSTSLPKLPPLLPRPWWLLRAPQVCQPWDQVRALPSTLSRPALASHHGTPRRVTDGVSLRTGPYQSPLRSPCDPSTSPPGPRLRPAGVRTTTMTTITSSRWSTSLTKTPNQDKPTKTRSSTPPLLNRQSTLLPRLSPLLFTPTLLPRLSTLLFTLRSSPSPTLSPPDL